MAKLSCQLLSLAVLSLAHLAMSSSSSSSHRHQHRQSSESSPSSDSQTGQDSLSLSYSYVQSSPGHCPNCPTREEQKEARTKFLKAKILTQLGMEKPPNVTFNRNVIPAIPALTRVLDEYEMQGMAPDHHYHQPDDDWDDHRKTPITKLLIPSPLPDSLEDANPETDVYFNFRSDMMPSQVSSARLYVYLRGTTSGQVGNSVLLVQTLSNNGQVQVIRKRRITVGGYRNGEWVSINIRSQVRQWLARPASNLGLRIQALDLTGTNLALVRARSREEEAFIPVLELKDPPPSRRRRDMQGLMKCRENSTVTNCCLFPLKVDFSKFGWEWIIAPRKYNANYCSGKCTFLFKTTHRVTHIVQQSLLPSQENAGPCCAPRKLKALHLVYFSEERQIIWGRLAGMIVEECGCA